MKINDITPDKNIFTQRLVNIANPPKRLCFIGQLPNDTAPVVAIVGTRKPSLYGIDVTKRLVWDLAEAGCVIVSGLALGIDCLAQATALETNGAVVVGVIANELPEISPRSNISLANKIIDNGGAIISEWKKGDGKVIGKWSFLERNRLVSGLADAVVVIEAAERSGTLNTAAHALDQGRALFAVPGNITSPLSVGCNSLIKQGAFPVTEANDIIKIIAPNMRAKTTNRKSTPTGNTPAENIILKLLINGVQNGEQLQQQSKLSAADFSSAITMLEINELIQPLGANHWSIK